MTRAVTAYVGLGSNLDDPERQVRAALAALDRLPGTSLTAASSLYRNPPMGPQDQPDYVNAVARLSTVLEPVALLDGLLGIEQRQGRRRGRRWGERILDLDLLLWGEREMAHERLTLPHPGLHERAFVLYPLAELSPALRVPGHGPVAVLCTRVDGSGLRRLPD
ncbi:2-amino-4-hydroxy-6-hydroxymethyldihydropteridine diphosphokinase [Ectothiorhodospiraceae bacterium WFHF3C12]|nr:2-amino-4-hydroxy-6-hydroxymethyldihydropteridine diphosphokinase [Ectothiorhodospiraceae bacterium WFHF3C12]